MSSQNSAINRARKEATVSMAPEAVRELLLGGTTEVFRWEDDDVALRVAASNSRLPWDRLTTHELEVFTEVSSDPAIQSMYLFIRNKLLQMWSLEPNVEVTLSEATAELPSPYNTNQHLLKRIHSYLIRYGYINYGFYYRLLPAPLSTKRPKKVIVIGAGLSGMAVHEQLQNFGFQVQVLEARKRVGGRIHTIRMDKGIAELGGSSFSGVMGNPLVQLAKQLVCPLQKMSEQVSVFNDNGTVIDPYKEKTVATLYNKLCTTAAYISQVKGITKISGEVLSLEDVLQQLQKLVELRCSRRLKRYWDVYEDVLRKKKQLQDEMVLLKKGADILAAKMVSMEKERNTRTDKNQESELEFDIMLRCAKYDMKEVIRHFDECHKKLKGIDAKLGNLKEMEANQNDIMASGPLFSKLMNFNYAQLECNTGTTLSNLNLIHWDHDTPFELKGAELTAHSTGMSSLFERFRANKKKNLYRCHIVDKIEYTKGGCRVTCHVDPEDEGAEPKAPETKIFEADAVVCTLPLGVLKKSIEGLTPEVPQFDPPLPQQKVDAIRQMGFGCVNKIALLFERPFWENYIQVPGAFGITSPSAASRGELFMFLAESTTPCLVGLFSGESASLTSEFDSKILAAKAMAQLQTIFGQACPKEPLSVALSHWHTDPYCYGAFSYMGKESHPGLYETLAQPVAYEGADPDDLDSYRLFFAGEHTCRNYSATTHGAFLSGLREAARMADYHLGRDFTADYQPECVDLASDDETERVEIGKETSPKEETGTSTGAKLEVQVKEDSVPAEENDDIDDEIERGVREADARAATDQAELSAVNEALGDDDVLTLE